VSAPHIAKTAWAFAKAGGGAHPPLFAALAKSATERAADFVAADLANLAWAFANAGHVEDAPLFAALARAAEARLSDFTAEELDNADWAFSRAGAWTSREVEPRSSRDRPEIVPRSSRSSVRRATAGETEREAP